MEQEMRQVVLAISRRDFYKTMTTHKDHRVWQDVFMV
ncbi:MAG: type II toxin-antitoxin system MqsR family toxin [Pseudomonadota bacterium]